MLTYRRLGLLLLPLLVVVAGCEGGTQGPADREPDVQGEAPAPEPVIERFKIAKDGALLLLPVRLKGKEFLFALDTGASSCVYDSSLAPLLGEPAGTEEVKTSDGVTRVQVFRPPDAKLGSFSLRTGSPVMAADLRRMREGSGEEVFGFIGMDFLARHVFRIDRDRGEVVFLRSAGPDPGRRLPVALVTNVPHVQVQVAGIEELPLFLVDTGASSGGGTGLMQAGTFDALAKQGRIKLTDNALAQSLSGTSRRPRGKVGEISLAGYRHTDLIFSASQRNLLGLNYWSRYLATFDFPGGAIYLKRGPRFDSPDTHDLSGLTLVRVNGHPLVLAVDEGSPAAAAGIRPQDVILKVNGEEAEAVALVGLRRLLAVGGTKVSLLLAQGGDEREVRLVLQPARK